MGQLRSDKVMLHLCITKESDDKINDLAGRMGLSKAALGSMLLDAGLEDNEFIIRAVTHPLAKRVIGVVRGKVPTKLDIRAE